MTNDSSAIKVVARFRPPNSLELAQGGETIVGFESEDTLSLEMKGV
jgi:kinesin family member 5